MNKLTGRDHIRTAMVSHNIVLFLLLCLTAFGIWSLPRMNKDEFPPFTIRQGVVAAIYPGATAQEVEAQVTGPLEKYLLTFQEVEKDKTYSITDDGVVYVYLELRTSVDDDDAVWTRIRAGLDLLKATELPKGVLETVVVDDFGNTSSMLLAVESADRTPRELEKYANELCSRLRTIPEMGNIKVLGAQKEEIAVTLDADRLSTYHIDQTAVMATLAAQGFRSVTGSMPDAVGGELIHVCSPYQTEYEIGEQIISSDPASFGIIRLKDVARIERRYPHPEKYIDYYSPHKASCVLIEIQMVDDKNIVAFGNSIETVLDGFRSVIPADVKFHRITDQPKVVDDSVTGFLGDIATSIVIVIMVMLLLFPMRTALVAGSGVPICIAITWGMMYIVGIQLHTVTLAALIVVLGMLVDNSIIVIDGYSNRLEQGYSSWNAASVSTKELFLPMAVATFSISGMFFPTLATIDGPIGEFVEYFPWMIMMSLTVSLFYAVWYTPHLCVHFIIPSKYVKHNFFTRGQSRFFVMLENGYEKLLGRCFERPYLTLLFTAVMLSLGVFLFTRGNLQLMPKADRECFAVEIHLNDGASVDETAAVADSLARMMCADERVKSITSFVGMSSPRFHCTYEPQIAKPSYAQFIVNTTSVKATRDIIEEYQTEGENLFTNASIRYKQMDYQAVKAPVEVYVSGDDLDADDAYAERLREYLGTIPELLFIRTDYDQSVSDIRIDMKEVEAERLGVTQSILSAYLASTMEGRKIATVWEDDYGVPVILYRSGLDSLDIDELHDMLVPTAFPGQWVPLHQVADISREWHHSSIGHRNNVPAVTIFSDLRGRTSQPVVQKMINRWVAENPAPEGVSVAMGGLTEVNEELIPQIVLTIICALLVMFMVLLYHYRKMSVSLLTISSSALCVFGSFLGLYIFDLDISITAVLGIISLIGVVVRNAIMMYEYAEELHFGRSHLSARDAAYQAGLRRMRPIFLTSATTALGVIPMITAGTGLWMPMGVVICFGTIFTLPLIVTALPVAYWKVYEK